MLSLVRFMLSIACAVSSLRTCSNGPISVKISSVLGFFHVLSRAKYGGINNTKESDELTVTSDPIGRFHGLNFLDTYQGYRHPLQ